MAARKTSVARKPPAVAAPALELRRVDDLLPYARNSRVHSDAQVAQIAASIAEFGLVGGIVVRDGVIAKGHGTLAALRKLMDAGHDIYPAPGQAAGASALPAGMVPVIDASGWTSAQFRAFVVADNKLALGAGWDDDMLAVELRGLLDEGFSIDVTGFDLDVLEALEGKPAASGGGGDPDAFTGDASDKWQLLLTFKTEAELSAAFDEWSQKEGVACKLMQ